MEELDGQVLIGMESTTDRESYVRGEEHKSAGVIGLVIEI